MSDPSATPRGLSHDDPAVRCPWLALNAAAAHEVMEAARKVAFDTGDPKNTRNFVQMQRQSAVMAAAYRDEMRSYLHGSEPMIREFIHTLEERTDV